MSATRSGARELAEEVGQKARELAGIVRRMIVTRATTGRWQILDHDMSAIGGESEPTRNAEVFGGIGFASRPAADGAVEAIVAFPGGPGNPIIIATRQEATRKIIAADLEADETQIHNSLVVIRIMAGGTVEIRTAAGVATKLPTLADFTALRAAFNSHTHVESGGTTATPLPQAAAATGTTVLKAE